MQFTQPILSTIHIPTLAVANERRSHYFFDTEEMRTFLAMMDRPYQHFVEMGEVAHLGHVLAFIRQEQPHLSVSLTTHTAFKQPVADLLSKYIAKHYGFSATLASDIKTCLQEAIMNSIIHGNLSIGHVKGSDEQFQNYLERISATINDETFSLKRVSIYLWRSDEHVTVCVSDQGRGFDLNQPTPDIAVPYGRGLPLIRTIAHRVWQSRPNHLSMQFLVNA